MILDDPLDIAQTALVRVANLASLLGVNHKRPICGRLGAELLLAADFLKSTDFDEEAQLRSRSLKLLRDVELICRWPHQKFDGASGYSLLKVIAQAEPGSLQYEAAETEVTRGLLDITSKHGTPAEKAIVHIERFTKHGIKKRREVDGTLPIKGDTLVEYSNAINTVAHSVLQDHMCCTCNNSREIQKAHSNHLAQLLLRRPLHDTISYDQVQFDMLFSSAPYWEGSYSGHWQDVKLLVSSVRKRKKKRARFVDSNGIAMDSRLPPFPQEQVDRGQLCKLISLRANSRLCLAIEDGKLQKSGFEPLQQLVEHIPGISLASILQQYYLTAKMRLALAYILAHSVWQYYDSGWMKTRWTSDTIQFMREYDNLMACGRGKFFAWKPYISVRFDNDDAELSEYSEADGEIHRYPRVRALGVMLAEIGIGSPLVTSNQNISKQVSVAEINKEFFLARNCLDDKDLWKDFEYPNYFDAVKNCLDPGIFALAPRIREVNDKKQLEALKQRRDILYDKVVFPLEDLLRGTRWMEQIDTIGPLETPAKSSIAQLVNQARGADAVIVPPIRENAKEGPTRGKKEARKWLSHVKQLNSSLGLLAKAIPLTGLARPIRIAILDTGCDDNASFFHSPGNSSRLKGWKDWVDDSDQQQDSHGHGTHLVSLIMNIAPNAHVYVARVAKNPDALSMADETVAEAISWASKEWEADIVSMSFGFAEEQSCISRAIRGAVHERDDSILFLAAASNFGANDKEMFPARHHSVISIRGTNANGDFEDFNPAKGQNEQTAFGTLGLEVPGAWLSDFDGEVYKSGCSVATAVAAGLAGMLLEYVSRKVDEAGFKDVVKKMRTRDGMEAMFRALAKPTLKESYLYLTPWKLESKTDTQRSALFMAALSDI